MWMDFLSKVVEGVLLALAPVLAAALASWCIAKVKTAWADFKVAQQVPSYWLEEVAEIVVKAAEQMELAKIINDKKSYAVQTAQLWLEQQGYKVDLAVIEAAIEAAVIEQFPKPE